MSIKVQLSVAALDSLRLQHLQSTLDPASVQLHKKIAGDTTWGGTVHGSATHIRWRWALLNNLVVAIDPARIETNLLLIDSRGAIEPALRACAHLLEYVETLPWRDPVRLTIGSETPARSDSNV